MSQVLLDWDIFAKSESLPKREFGVSRAASTVLLVSSRTVNTVQSEVGPKIISILNAL